MPRVMQSHQQHAHVMRLARSPTGKQPTMNNATINVLQIKTRDPN
jgi:hypothetical protein